MFILLNLFFLHRKFSYLLLASIFLLVGMQKTKAVVSRQEIWAFLADSSPETPYSAYSISSRLMSSKHLIKKKKYCCWKSTKPKFQFFLKPFGYNSKHPWPFSTWIPVFFMIIFKMFNSLSTHKKMHYFSSSPSSNTDHSTQVKTES